MPTESIEGDAMRAAPFILAALLVVAASRSEHP
jgi:hypothetical protein